MTTPIELEYLTVLALRNADGEQVRSVERTSLAVALVSALVWLSGAAVLWLG